LVHVKYKQFPTLRLDLEFGLYKISFYQGFWFRHVFTVISITDD